MATRLRDDAPLVSASQIRRALTSLLPDLAEFWTRPLIDYAHAAYDEPQRGHCFVRTDAMGRLQKLINDTAIRSGANPDLANEAARQIAELPVIQSGPHCFLLVDPEAFYTHLFSALGLTSHKRRWHIYFGCSTVKFIERGNKGPGLLPVGDQIFNVFGMSRTRMASTNLSTAPGPFKFRFDSDQAVPPNSPVIGLADDLSGSTYPNAADAIISANQTLWRRAFPPLLEILQFDDLDVCDLVASHFEDDGSWLSRRFTGNGMVGENVLRLLDELNDGPWAGWVRRTTDFFWGVARGQIYPLRLNNSTLSATNTEGFSIPFEPKHLSEALRERLIVPNLFTAAIVTSILPGVRLLGGSRQVIYLPLMRFLFARSLDAHHDDALLTAISKDRHASMWGHRVLRPVNPAPLFETESRQHGLAIAAAYGQRSLEIAAGNLSFFAGDPMWLQMCQRLSNGNIDSYGPEWQLG
jgi:hypothetical protein